MATMNPTVIMAVKRINNKPMGLPLQWKQNNGILIAGLSGSGKSQTAAWLLTQYAYAGVQLIVCDYDAPVDDDESEALSDRIHHLEKSFLMPPVRKVADIKRYLTALEQEYELRLNDPTRRFPLMFVIDEVSALLSELKDDTEYGGIQTFAANMLKIRKVNMRAMIIGQEWSSGFSTQIMRPIRSAFRVKIIHNLDSANAKLVLDMPTSDDIRTIGKLQTGQIFFNGDTYQVPLLSDVFIEKVERTLAEYVPESIQPPVIKVETKAYDWSIEDEKMYMNMLFKYGPKVNIWRLDTRGDLIHNIIRSGQNKEFVKNHIKGNVNDNAKIAQQFIEEYD